MHLGWFATTGFGVYGWEDPWVEVVWKQLV